MPIESAASTVTAEIRAFPDLRIEIRGTQVREQNYEIMQSRSWHGQKQ